MVTTPIEALNNKIAESQRQALDKGRQMATILKGKIDGKKKSHALWIVTTIKNIIRKPVKEIVIPVFTFKQTQEAVFQNSNLLSDFGINIGA